MTFLQGNKNDTNRNSRIVKLDFFLRLTSQCQSIPFLSSQLQQKGFQKRFFFKIMGCFKNLSQNFFVGDVRKMINKSDFDDFVLDFLPDF